MKWSKAAILAAIFTLGCSGDESDGQAGPPDGGMPIDGGAGGSDTLSESSTDDVLSERRPIPDVSTDVAPGDRFIDIFDAFPLPDGPLGACVACVRDRCGAEVNDCANDDVCRAGLLCTITTCVPTGGDGGLDFACVSGCFMGDLRAVLTAVGSSSCINMNCSAACLPTAVTEGGVPGDGGAIDTGSSTDTGGSIDTGISIDTDAADVRPGD